jgi:pimeloyl-ACP methyl ester carboxylesterase
MGYLALGILLALCSACTHVRVPMTPLRVEQDELALAGINGCGDERSVALDPARPLAILVHGLHSSGDGFQMLADTFQAGGQQALCFRYDGRESMRQSGERLRAAVAALASKVPSITLFGHSQGGLVARAALGRREEPLPRGNYRLVTVSSPFAGIRIARSCGSIAYHLVSLGVSYAVCRAISGNSWNEIHPRARMVRAPAELDPAVDEHLLVVTDERDTCRRYSADGLRCLQDDYVFSTGEQHNRKIEHDPRVVAAALTAGHVEVVGAQGPPRELIRTLQQHGVLAGELSERAAVFEEQTAKSGW